MINKSKLLAEFMGLVPSNNGLYTVYGKTYRPSELEYNSNWRWLTDVTDKAMEICQRNEIDGWIRNISKPMVDIDINATFEEVSRFIEWYNKNFN